MCNKVSTWTFEAGRHHLLHIAAIQIGLHDAVKRDIRPEHQLLAVVEVKCDGVLQVIQQQCVLRAVRQNLTDIYPICKQQHRLWT